jgi:predicted transglutaminase-like protease
VNFNKSSIKGNCRGYRYIEPLLKALKTPMKDGVQTMINGSYVIKSQTSKTSNITKVTISRLKNNGGLVMDNGTLVQINTKTEQATKKGI